MERSNGKKQSEWEIVCRTGSESSDRMAKQVILRAGEGLWPKGGGRLVFTCAPGEGENPPDGERWIRPTAETPALARPFSIAALEEAVRRVLAEEKEAQETKPCSFSKDLPDKKSAGVVAPSQSPSLPTDGDIVFRDGVVSRGDTAVRLTKREAAFFQLLYENRGTPVSRERILREVWGNRASGNVCEVYACYLRAKLEPVFGKGFLIGLHREGYLLL